MLDDEHLIPKFDKPTDEEMNKLMKDLKSVDKITSVGFIYDTLYKMLSSQEYVDLSALDKLIPDLIISDELLEIICVLVLKNINFNFEFLYYKLKIYEKQNLKLEKCFSCIKYCRMNNLRNILLRFLTENHLLDTAKHVRIYICYCVLENMANVAMNSTVVEMSRKNNDLNLLESSSYEKNLQHSFFKLKNNKSFEGMNRIEALETMDLTEYIESRKRYIYEGVFDIFYSIEYIIYNDIYVIEKWLKNQKVTCSWKLLGLPNDNFILNEIKHIKDVKFLYNLILKTKSHYLIYSFLIRLIKNLKFSKSFTELVVLSYDEQNASNTIKLFEMLYKEDKEKANILLEDVIIKHKTLKLKEPFFNHYDIIGYGYLKCLKVHINDIESVNLEHLRELLALSYFHILIEEYENFIKVFAFLEKKNLFHAGIENILKIQWEFNITNLNKIKYLYSKYDIEKEYFKDIIVSFIDLLFKKNVEYNSLINLLKTYIDQEVPNVEKKEENSGIVNLGNRNDKNLYCDRSKGSIKRIEENGSESAKEISQDITEISDNNNRTCIEANKTADLRNYKKENHDSLLFNNTINFPLLIDNKETRYVENKKYIVKKDTFIKMKNICKCILTDENIKGMIDLYFVYKNENLPKKVIKKIYHVDSDAFIQKILKSETFDAFFAKNINTISNETIFLKYLDNIKKLNIFKKNDYWHVALRNRLKFSKKCLLKEKIKKNIDYTKDDKKVLKKENSSEGLYHSTDTSVKESNVDLSVLNSRNYKSDIFENTQMLRVSNSTTFIDYVLAGNMDSISLDSPADKIDTRESRNKKIRKGNIGLLSIEGLYKLLNDDNCSNPGIIKKEINNRTKYPTGLCFNDSYIRINNEFKNFVLNIIVYQYSIEGEQYILEIENENESFRLGTYNGKLYQEIEYNIANNRKIERKLLTLDCTYLNELYIECKYRKRKMHMTLLNKIYIFNLSKARTIIICRNFKGIMNKLILHEFTGYNSSRLTNLDKSALYIKVLQKLERYLVYNNMKGVFIDSYVPYFFNEKIDIEYFNILESKKYTR